jgi:hypothetical protein
VKPIAQTYDGARAKARAKPRHAVAFVGFFTTGEQLADLKLLIGFCMALVSITVPLQLELLFRLTERARTRERYGMLLEMVEEYPYLLPIIVRTAEAGVATLKNTRVEQFKECVPSILGETQVRMQELAQGRLRTRGGDNALLLERFAAATDLVQGTTDEGDTGWWRQANGKHFLALNRDLIARGVTIERVWILSARPSDETQRVLEEHHSALVKVFVVRLDALEGTLLINMTMMDEEFLHEDVTNKLGNAEEYLFSENSADLSRAKSRFSQLKAKAIEYDGKRSIDDLVGVV